MNELLDLLSGRRHDVTLDRAALQLATIEFPGLEMEPYVALLDSYAVELADRLPNDCGPQQYVAATNQYLFEELGFQGNQEDYYNPLNSCLNEVLTARRGIPITLSVVYLEIARRLAKPIRGIGMPGHFLVQYAGGDYQPYIDVYNGGRLLEPLDCLRIAREAGDNSESMAALAPVGNRHIMLRMTNNLRSIYFMRRSYPKVLQVLNLVLAADPRAAEEYRQRGLVNLQLRNFGASRADFEKYLALAPNASDRADIESQLRAVKQWQVGLN